MTIKELYNWAVENKAEDLQLFTVIDEDYARVIDEDTAALEDEGMYGYHKPEVDFVYIGVNKEVCVRLNSYSDNDHEVRGLGI